MWTFLSSGTGGTGRASCKAGGPVGWHAAPPVGRTLLGSAQHQGCSRAWSPAIGEMTAGGDWLLCHHLSLLSLAGHVVSLSVKKQKSPRGWLQRREDRGGQDHQSSGDL